MNWDALKKNRCAKCNGDLVKTMVPAPAGHIKCKCGFLISEEKYKEIVSDRVGRDIDKAYEDDAA